jgi:hypothetical protein
LRAAFDMPHTRYRLVGIAVCLVLGLIISGCATDDGDMPWATPQSWEGAPTIPGLSQP